MRISRNGDTVRVSEPGHAEDDTNIHEFSVVEDLCEDPVDVMAAAEGHTPKASVSFRRSGNRDNLGLDWWTLSKPPRRVIAYLEANGYIVVASQAHQ